MESIALEKSPLTPRLIQSYLSQSKDLAALYSHFPLPENFKKQAALKKNKYQHREVLCSVLKEQYQHLKKHTAVMQNLEALQSENTFTITTAHQTNVFTGPIYYIYKILHAIKLAESLNEKYTEYHFVPVYWMGSEDHDFEEINHFHLFGKKLAWQTDEIGACGNFNPSSLKDLADEALSILQPMPHAAEILQIFKQHYGTATTLAEATQSIINELFGHYGLVVIHPNHQQLKKCFEKIFSAELNEQVVATYSQAALNQLNDLGYKIQAKPREINLFYLSKEGRNRIVFDQEKNEFLIVNTNLHFDKNALKQELQNFPERFSPNVFLRPLFQEIVLPNIAYVGGSGEISYWLEQKNIFDYFDIPFPILQLRNSFLLVDANSQKKLLNLQLKAVDFLQNETDIIHQLVTKNAALPEFDFEKKQLLQVFESLKNKAVSIDTTLSGTVEAQWQQVLNNLEVLEKKILKAEKTKQETAVHQIKSIKQKFFPQQIFQERFDNFLPHYAEMNTSFFDLIFQNITPYEAQLHILHLEK